MDNDACKGFFENDGLVRIVDNLAQRYGCLPHEIMSSTIFDFCFDAAVMVAASKPEKPKEPETDWGSLGISRKLVKKKKEE